MPTKRAMATNYWPKDAHFRKPTNESHDFELLVGNVAKNNIPLQHRLIECVSRKIMRCVPSKVNCCL